jgi:hypothetical protein
VVARDDFTASSPATPVLDFRGIATRLDGSYKTKRKSRTLLWTIRQNTAKISPVYWSAPELLKVKEKDGDHPLDPVYTDDLVVVYFFAKVD